ncbi:MAG: alpha-hydroxy-acid oxidizing protein [Haloplanus sp.]
MANYSVERRARLDEEGSSVPLSRTALREAALDALPEAAAAYLDGGAGGDGTVAANREAFDRWRLVPRVYNDVADRDLSVDLFGHTYDVPFMTAPIGNLSKIHAGAETAVARAAADVDVPVVLSTVATDPLEDVAAALGDDGHGWFQLYRNAVDEVAHSLVERAEAAGYEAVVVTVDTPYEGWRERQFDAGFRGDADEGGHGLGNFVTDPAVAEALGYEPSPDDPEAVDFIQRNFCDPAHTWTDFDGLRAHTDLPILAKGVLHPDDAAAAVAAGADGIVVSNHGGRQVDGSVAALSALPAVADAVDVPVLFDSGVRGGADALKSLALGADAVCLGRPYAYGLAVAGETGVRDVLANFRADLDATLGLVGHDSVTDLDRSVLVRRGESPG